MLDDGQYHYSYGKLIRFKKFEKTVTPAPILVSEKVFEEYKKLNLNKDEITKGWWTVQDVSVKEYSGKIYGCKLTWSAANEISIKNK